MERHLSIDLETYSSVNLQESGMFKYIESPDFQILLFAYSLDGGTVEIVDLAMGEPLPPWLASAITDPTYIKYAYNAMFEWGCLSKYFGILPANQWRCTMVHGLYCGYTAGLEKTGAALELDIDKRKLSSGKALIRYFCVPCRPTKTNGGRTRNLPHHDSARWQKFKEYCKQDVVTEMEIENRLAAFPMPDFVQKEWETDLQINARGVAVDSELVKGALRIDEKTRAALIAEAMQITGLNNPNSVTQLKDWINKEIGSDNEQLTSLAKDAVSSLLDREDISGAARRVLEIRQELGKTSTKKYDALEATICADGRVRGLLQFYGGNRTGRWAGRLVQVQNLPRTYIDPLPLARGLVRAEQTDALQIVYGSVPDTLSQLIRTAFIAPPGSTLIDADFSAIEARVIAWLAGEQWRLNVFRTHGKIYEASASQMFGVPLDKIVKGNPEYALRQKGKVAELALGYQGAVGAMRKMDTSGQLADLSDDEVMDIVNRWRDSNRRICDLWYAANEAAVEVVSNGGSVSVGRTIFSYEFDRATGIYCMTILLPSGRKLYYVKPSISTNRWGKPAVSYLGMDQDTKKWGVADTYGGKLVENITQAIARDCLACAVERLEAAGMRIVFHVHDEVVIETRTANADLNTVIQIMSAPVPWAPDLPLSADGWMGDFYRKD